MSSNNQSSNVEQVTINSDLIQHSEYDVEVADNSDVSFARDVNKLVINPTHIQNVIAFKKNKDTLLTIPVKDIDSIVVTPHTEQGLKKEKENLPIQIAFRDNTLQNLRSITFVAKNKKYVNVIQQQLQILKDAETDPTIQHAIVAILNPSLCNKCIENKFIFEFNSNGGKLCLSCFEKTYGKILLQTADKEPAEYYGGHKDHVQGGFLAKPQSGNIYLTENYIIFAKQDKDISKRWQILIQLSSVILNWDTEQKEREKNVQWEGTSFHSFGFGCGFIRASKKIDSLVVPYIDGNGNPHEPEFSIPDVQQWASELYRMSVKAKVNLLEPQNKEEDIVLQTAANCFNCGRQFRVYDLIICNHCITSFCDTCIKNHSATEDVDFDSEYMGGHKLYPKSSRSRVHIFSDRIEVEALHLRIPYTSITDIENADEQKISAMRMFLVGMYSFAWKKKDVYTIIQYVDGFDQKQALIFDFGKKLEEAQQKIYDRMLASRFTKERLLESQKKMDYNIKSFQPQTKSTGETKPEINTRNLPMSGMSDMIKINKSNDDNPLNILKIRLAKGEITKEEYEEMRRMIES